MDQQVAGNVTDIVEFRDRIHIFRDRGHAGEILTGMLDSYKSMAALVLAIPAGGVPVASVIARELDLPLDVVVVSKITLPWNTEAGYGAVAFDGTVLLNERLLLRLGLSEEEIQEGIERTSSKVARRVTGLRGERPFPDLRRQSAILVDDGLASGFTLLTGIKALREAEADRIIVVIPTGHWDSVEMIAPRVDAVFCANIRRGWSFAVADAYQQWSDVSDEDVAAIMAGLKA
jgi:predicted phosphoribosyltransferase